LVGSLSRRFVSSIPGSGRCPVPGGWQGPRPACLPAGDPADVPRTARPLATRALRTSPSRSAMGAWPSRK